MKDIWAIKIIEDLLNSGYTGKIETNSFKGGVTNINLTQSIKQGDVIKIVDVKSQPE